MKKLIVEQKWKQYLAAKSRYQQKENARFAKYRREKNAQTSGVARPKRFHKQTTLAVPEVFSIIQNPSETIAFFNRMRTLATNRNVFVDLSEVTTMTPDAIACLLATIHNRQIGFARISGNLPNDPTARRMLNDSGFRDYVKSTDGFHFRATMGKVVKKRERSRETLQMGFDQFVAKELVAFAIKKLTGTSGSHKPSQSVFAEAMLNTLNHASAPGNAREPWWASVFYDKERRRASFTFIDQGVGIFRSHKLTLKLNVLQGFLMLDSGTILERIFKGEVPSTTGQAGRGNGIPGMYTHCKAGRIKSFAVIANDAIGEAETDRYQTLKSSFPGTILYWEVEV